MTVRSRCMSAIVLVLCMALTAWSQQYQLYTPHPVTGDPKTAAQGGILVQEIEVHKGDTPKNLSRKYIGRGTYFPQILLFNPIKNPDLIYPGNILKIPVAQKEMHSPDRGDAKPAAVPHKPAHSRETLPPARQSTGPLPVSSSSSDLSLSYLKTVETKNKKARTRKRKPAVHAQKGSGHEPRSSSPSAQKGAATGQKLYEAALKAQQRNDYRSAIVLFDRFLAGNPGSPLAADATLHKADCYLKLSAQ